MHVVAIEEHHIIPEMRRHMERRRDITADTQANRAARKWTQSPAERLTTRSASHGRLHVIACRATLDVPRELAQFTARLLAAERRRRGTPRGSRALTCCWQAVLGLRWFRDRASPDALARDHGISRTTAYRYLDEVIAVLAGQAPRSAPGPRAGQAGRRFSRNPGRDGHPGGPLPGEDRQRPRPGHRRVVFRQGPRPRRQHPGGHRPGRFPLWVSKVEPGSVHDITAARIHALPALYHAPAAGLLTLADPGYDGAGIGIHVSVKQPPGRQELDINTRTRNALLRSRRCLGERGFAVTARWRALQHITLSPGKIGDIARAALVLTHFEYGYIK
jgi:DDE superfamily endonuclease